MDPENKGDTPKEFGKVIDALHSKQKLPSLRTYQGDMAEFIKNKNESVISLAIKTKERKEEKREEEKLENYPKQNGKGFQLNFKMIILSLILIFAGGAGLFYVFQTLQKEPMAQVIVEEKIIPYNNLITLTNVTSENLGAELGKLSPSSGINVIKVSDASGLSFQKSRDFLSFLGIVLPATLERTLKDEYAVGVFSQNKENSFFLIITVDDFGGAFSGMLDWEGSMEKDLSFLNPVEDTDAIAPVPTNIATSTTASTTTAGMATSTIISVKIPLRPEVFSWRDIIIKNKDTRALANDKNVAKIAYTFLNKNTILIVNDISVVGDISSAYSSRSVVR